MKPRTRPGSSRLEPGEKKFKTRKNFKAGTQPGTRVPGPSRKTRPGSEFFLLKYFFLHYYSLPAIRKNLLKSGLIGVIHAPKLEKTRPGAHPIKILFKKPRTTRKNNRLLVLVQSFVGPGLTSKFYQADLASGISRSGEMFYPCDFLCLAGYFWH